MAIVTPIETPTGARRRLKLVSPVRLEPIGEIEVQTSEDVCAAVEIARKAQPAWAALSFKQRAQYMLRALRILHNRHDDIINVVQRETGKARNDAIMLEIFLTSDELLYYAKNAAKILRPERKKLHGLMQHITKLRIEYRPLGVVGVISPWNGPFVLSMNPTIQALMAGNAVLLKPSSATPYSGKLVGDLFEEAGLPRGVLTVLLGDSETGAALVEADVDKICFTGSTAVGRQVAIACAEKLIPCSLELGGKDPMIVCADADLDNAAGGAVFGAYVNTGMYCSGTERVYVVEAVADEFIRKVVERSSSLRQESDGEFEVGAITWPQQLDLIEEHVSDAVAKGAKVLVGGRRNPRLKGLYYEPTVLTNVTHDMLIMTEECMGPILPIMCVHDEEEAIRLANASDYGLGANVWTQDERKGMKIARRLNCGSVCINNTAITYGATEAPFGGWKNSGIGYVNGEIGLKSFCHIQPILTDLFGGAEVATRYPYSSQKEADMQNIIRATYSPDGNST
jgi:acyl-CoA reductase-like NAD-dependent aldehyde dehydrogenase